MEKFKVKSSTMFFYLFFFFFFFFFFLEMEMEMVTAQQHADGDLSEIAGYGEEKLSSVVIVGSVTCNSMPTTGHVAVAGAEISVACKEGIWKRSRRKQGRIHGTTDEYGEFMVDLPSKLHGIPSLEKACVVKIMRLPKEYSICRRKIRRRRRTRIQLSSVGNTIRFYTAGTIKL